MTAFSGVRGRVTFAVLAVAALVFSIVGTVGFVLIARSGRDAVRDRIEQVLEDLEQRARSGIGVFDVSTADGVSATVVSPDATVDHRAGEVVVVRTVLIGNERVQLVGRASDAPVARSLQALFRGVWIAVPLATVLCALLAGLATRRALRPVADITSLASSFTATVDDSSERVPVPDTGDEIEHLAVTLNAMFDRIEHAGARQRRFTSDAAHELRTPLMALMGELELAASNPGSVDVATFERLGALGIRLSERVDDLVLLATLDEARPAVSGPIDLRAVVTEEVDAHDPSVAVSGAAATVAGDRLLLARAVRNLLANARRHARSTVAVELVADDGSGHALVHVDDDGPGIDPIHRDEVFRRFARLDESRSRDAGGSGLGLAIVRSVAEAHGGTVAVSEGGLGGARFTLRLPLRAVDGDDS